MHIETFESWEEADATMSRYENQANDGLMDFQVALRDDADHTRYWVRPVAELNCLIFGIAWSFKDSAESSAKYVEPHVGRGSAVHRMMDLNVDDVTDYLARYEESLAEAVFEIRNDMECRQRGYLRGIAYSIIEPDGELGSTHVSQVVPISEQAFEEARASGWRAVEVDPLTLDLIGEDAAHKGGWTPTLIRELHEHDEVIRAAREERGD